MNSINFGFLLLVHLIGLPSFASLVTKTRFYLLDVQTFLTTLAVRQTTIESVSKMFQSTNLCAQFAFLSFYFITTKHPNHAGGSELIITDPSNFYQEFLYKFGIHVFNLPVQNCCKETHSLFTKLFAYSGSASNLDTIF